jgi:hypothetical protein
LPAGSDESVDIRDERSWIDRRAAVRLLRFRRAICARFGDRCKCRSRKKKHELETNAFADQTILILGGAAQYEDLAAAVVALIAYPAITGTVLDVDGGESLGTWAGEP